MMNYATENEKIGAEAKTKGCIGSFSKNGQLSTRWLLSYYNDKPSARDNKMATELLQRQAKRKRQHDGYLATTTTSH